MQINKDSQKTEVSLDEARAWKQEAEALGRSKSHLDKIDLTIKNAEKTQIGDKPAISLKEKDALAIKKDREDFEKMQLKKQQTQQSKATEINQSKGIKR